ncbi:MAG: DUF192 domain-containing protein, partial [Candidatus Micrarchaeota archaeon]
MKIKYACNFFGQMRGLMFRQRKNFNYALVFPLGGKKKMGAAIHSFFVFFPFDAVWLDGGKIIDIRKS